MESEQAPTRGLNKEGGSMFMLTPEFGMKHLRKAGGHIDRKVVNIKTKIKTIVRKPLRIKIYLSLWPILTVLMVAIRPLRPFFQSFGDYTEHTAYDWHHCHFYVPQFFSVP